MTKEERKEAIEYLKKYREFDKLLYQTEPFTSISRNELVKCLRYWDTAIQTLEQEEPTSEQVEEYCRKRCLTLVCNEFMAHIIADNGDSIRTIPSAEKTGHWISIIRNEDMFGVRCSKCEAEYTGLIGANFCPNCGAKMEKEK